MSLWRKMFPVRERPWETYLFGAKLGTDESLYESLAKGYEESKSLYLYIQARLALAEKGVKARPVTGDEAKLREWEVDMVDRSAKISVLRDILRIPVQASKQAEKIIKKREQEEERDKSKGSFVPK